MSETFNLKGVGRPIAKEELKIIKFDELLKYAISPGFIFYLSMETGKPFLLLNPGDVVEQEFVDKYQNKGMRSFFILEAVNDANVQQFKLLFERLKERQLDEERTQAASDILILFKNIYWSGSTPGNILDLIFSLNITFYKLDEKIGQEMQKVSNLMFTRSLMMAALGVITALIDDVNDFEMLQDIYHACFLLDYGLVSDDYSYVIGQANEEERIHPGQGLGHIATNTFNKDDILFFRNHSAKSISKIKDECMKVFKYQEVLVMILRHHELKDGSGFPHGLMEKEMRSFETIPILIDHLIPSDDLKFKEGDGTGWFKKLFEKSYASGALKIPIKRLLSKLNAKIICAEGTEAA